MGPGTWAAGAADVGRAVNGDEIGASAIGLVMTVAVDDVVSAGDARFGD